MEEEGELRSVDAGKDPVNPALWEGEREQK